MKNNKEQLDIYKILDEYKPDDDLFSEEDERINKVKHIIYDCLTESNKRIILLYAEYGSLRDVADILNVSHTTIFYEIKKIKKIITDLYDAFVD